MTSRRARHNDDAPGHDSFLDIVANLVGILVILVMVIGVRAKDAMVEAAGADPDTQVARPEGVAAAESHARSIEQDVHQLVEKVQDARGEIAAQSQRRDQLQLLVTAAEAELGARRDRLDDAARDRFDRKRHLAEAADTLDRLNRQRRAVRIESSPTVVEHLPTPLAKTVFGKEEHFRLLHGRLVYVPLNELVERLKAEAPHKLWKLKDGPSLTETIGPLEGFRMKYTIHKVDYTVETAAGDMRRQRVELAHFDLLPVSDDLGEPLERALTAGSHFAMLLDTMPTAHTTITVWTYPDSFQQFRLLKRYLYDRGYACAARPMPEGRPIGGSPTGSRSAAE